MTFGIPILPHIFNLLLLFTIAANEINKVSAICQNEYKESSDGIFCYKFFSNEVTWDRAQQICYDDNAYLLQVKWDTVTINMDSFTDDFSANKIWIALRRMNDYFQWLGEIPQLFTKNTTSKWGQEWDNNEPVVWNGCAVLVFNTGKLMSRNCADEDTKFSFICVQTPPYVFASISNDQVEVRVTAFLDKNPLPANNSAIWLDADAKNLLMLKCLVFVNGQDTRFSEQNYEKIQYVWTKNGVHMAPPIAFSMYPAHWPIYNQWIPYINNTDFKHAFGTYSCEARLPFQSKRFASKPFTVLFKDWEIFRYEIEMPLTTKTRLTDVEPTTAKPSHFNRWNRTITYAVQPAQTASKSAILPMNEPKTVDTKKLQWVVHAIRPMDITESSSGSITKTLLVTIFVAVEKLSRMVKAEDIREKLVDFKKKSTNNYTVEIHTVGHCTPKSEDVDKIHFIWSLQPETSQGFSDPLCITHTNPYQKISRQCKINFLGTNDWEDFDYSHCTAHLLEEYFCPENHKIVEDNYCAFVGSADANWEDANALCKRMGSHLPHHPLDLQAAKTLRNTSWSVARMTGGRVYPKPSQPGDNLAECVVFDSGKTFTWQRTECSHKRPFICVSRFQTSLWKVPWCLREWSGSEILSLNSTCFFVNKTHVGSSKDKASFCESKKAQVADTSDPVLHVLVATEEKRQRVLSKRSFENRVDFSEVPFTVCQRPRTTRPPRKPRVILTGNIIEDKIQLICNGVNIRSNSHVVWYHNGDPYPPDLVKFQPEDKEYLDAVYFTKDVQYQGEYWCEAWNNAALKPVPSNKVTFPERDVNNYVILLNTGNSSKTELIELSNISTFFNLAETSIVRREVTLYNNSQLAIWIHVDSSKSPSETVEVVRKRFTDHLTITHPTFEVRSTEFCLNETTTSGDGKLMWPQTKRGHVALPVELCSTEDRKPVSRECLGNFRLGAYWADVEGSCTEKPHSELTKSLYDLSKTNVTNNNAYGTSVDLQSLTTKSDKVEPVDIAYVAKTMQKISSTDDHSMKTLESVVKTVDNVMNVDTDKVVSSQRRSQSSNKITQTLDRMVNSVELEEGSSCNVSLPNIYIESHVLPTEPDAPPIVGIASYKNRSSVSLTSEGNLIYDETRVAVLLPPDFVNKRRSSSDKKTVRLSFVIYENSNLFMPRNASGTMIVDSQVISAKISGQRARNLDPPVILVFRPIQEVTLDSVSCVYWDQRLNKGRGDWSTDGCWLSSFQPKYIVCKCNHLTNFAVLMDVYGQDKRVIGVHRHVLNGITYLGSALSIVGLTLTIFTFLIFRKWRKKDGNKVVCNLALALLLLLVVFLAGIEQTESEGLCLAVAVLLHYFILAAFCWMLVEALQQYLLFVRVLGTYIPRFLLKAMLFGWGAPMIIIIIVLAVDTNLYIGGTHYCWMKMEALYFAFLLPLGIIIIVNAIVFILVIRGITCGRRTTLQTNQSKQRLMRTQLYAALCIFILLGLTWIFGFLAIEDARLLFQYLFCIFNSLQGLFIFFFMVVRDRNANDLWRSLCVSADSKRGATTSDSRQRRLEEQNVSDNFTTKLMMSRSSTNQL